MTKIRRSELIRSVIIREAMLEILKVIQGKKKKKMIARGRSWIALSSWTTCCFLKMDPLS